MEKADKGKKGKKGRITNAQCPMPNAQCPMPNAPCPITKYKGLSIASGIDQLGAYNKHLELQNADNKS
ncbi:hypothetical protein BLD44_025275 [Mastigocladus laminosus UU774]|nr:hypothetical protein BLD44_025275 [Mastigocladus laminosus UU774]